MSIFFFLEHLCYDELTKNIQDKYKQELSDELRDNLSQKLLDNNKLNDKFTIKELGAALRRLISRYLVGKNAIINENNPLLPVLKKPELWEEEIAHLKNLEELIFNLLGKYNLTVGQSFNLYDLIKEEDEKEIAIDEEVDDEGEDEGNYNPTGWRIPV